MSTGLGVFFLIQILHNCGYQFVMPIIGGLLFGISCMVLRQIQSGWNSKLIIAIFLVSLGAIATAVFTISVVNGETLCGT